MFPGNFVQSTPDKPAVIRPATGESITYRELDERSTQLARYFRSVGCQAWGPRRSHLEQRSPGVRGVLGSVEIRPLHHRGELASHGFGGCLHRRRLRGDNSGGVGAGVRSSSVGREADSTRAAPIGVRRRPSRASTTTKKRSMRSPLLHSTRSRVGLTCCIRREPPAGRRGSKEISRRVR